MPYIVKTTRKHYTDAAGRFWNPRVLSDVAVATLDEARAKVVGPEGAHVPAIIESANRLITEQGGSVSLPDGTTIEVERASYDQILLRIPAGQRPVRSRGDAIWAPVLDAYNAAQVSS